MGKHVGNCLAEAVVWIAGLVAHVGTVEKRRGGGAIGEMEKTLDSITVCDDEGAQAWGRGIVPINISS